MKLFDKEVLTRGGAHAPTAKGAQKSLAELIMQLRACANVPDVTSSSKNLLTHVLEVKSDRNACSMAVKRIRAGEAPQ